MAMGKSIEVILLDDVPELGRSGDACRVRSGYARNFLFPQKLAVTLTPGTITVHSEGDRLTVHCLDTQFMEGIDDTSFSQALEKMQKTKEEEA